MLMIATVTTKTKQGYCTLSVFGVATSHHISRPDSLFFTNLQFGKSYKLQDIRLQCSRKKILYYFVFIPCQKTLKNDSQWSKQSRGWWQRYDKWFSTQKGTVLLYVRNKSCRSRNQFARIGEVQERTCLYHSKDICTTVMKKDGDYFFFVCLQSSFQ